MTEDEILVVIRRAVDEAGSLAKAGKLWGLSKAYLSFVLNKRQPPGPTLLAALGYEREVSVAYRPKSARIAAGREKLGGG
jgi:hypothetical protein